MRRITATILVVLAAVVLPAHPTRGAGNRAPSAKPPQFTTQLPRAATPLTLEQRLKQALGEAEAQRLNARTQPGPTPVKGPSFGTALTPEQSGLDRAALAARLEAKLEAMRAAQRGGGPAQVRFGPTPRSVPPFAPRVLTPAEQYRVDAAKARSAAGKEGGR